MKGRCTGVITSTFAGGGGTKVFCSQALKTAIATIAKPARLIVAPFCAAVPHDSGRAGEREAFIFRAPIFLSGKGFSQKSAFRYPMKIATIRLRRNQKAKMMCPDFSK
ncbi:hypothetical protein [Bradyrhizobium sp. CB3481]|uniref:hypothetical protein n=1 Tax=Bradyrhizobium sp. CB3481 TaxID=3039158 RepID=UPI0024B15033|nr:hypothetical protein [Bradyrhizobium sp. CB3481]WFU20790.1 hypothetical protein QA643_37485 [Bradyrhizobium sp. CB3481]